MSLILGCLLGIGVLLIWQSGFPSAPRTSPKPISRWRRRLDRAGMQATPVSRFLATCAGSALLVDAAVLLIAGSLPVAAIFAAFAAQLPSWWLGIKAERRAKALREVWPDVVDHLRSAVRAGLPLTDALAQLGRQGPPALRGAFSAFAADLRVARRVDDALEGLQTRLADPVGDRVIASVRLTREVGGAEVGEMLSTLSAFLRTDARTRGELEARQSWTVNGARLAVAAPWAILLLLCLESRVAAAYSTPQGILVLLIGAGVAAVCYRLMMRIARLPDEERVFA